MSKKLCLILIAGLLPLAASAREAGEFLIRSRAVYIQPVMSTSNQATPLTSANKVDASGAMIPEFDFSYFVMKNVALEMIVGTSRHEIYLDGASLGRVSALPPSLTAQYHLGDLFSGSKCDPYFGAGLNYTYFYNSNLKTGGAPLFLTKGSIGMVFQAGADVTVNERFFLNFDVKKFFMSSNVSLSEGGSSIATVKMDPMVWGFGIGVKL